MLILITFKLPQRGSKKYKQSSYIYGKPFRVISLPDAMHEYLKPDIDI